MRHTSAEVEGGVGLLDPVEVLHATQPDDLAEILQFLGDPEADIRAAREQGRVGVAKREIRHGLDAGGGREEARLMPDEEIRTFLQGFQPQLPALGIRRENIGRRAMEGGHRGIGDRAIARAAAEIAGEDVIEGRAGQRAFGLVIGREEAHHDARRAEAALRAVMRDHRLLDRVELPAGREILHGQHFRAVDLAKQENAGIHRLIAHAALAQAGEHDGAGPAIAFVAAFLRAGGALLLAQPFEQREGGIEAVAFDGPATEDETQGATHAVIAPPAHGEGGARNFKGERASGHAEITPGAMVDREDEVHHHRAQQRQCEVLWRQHGERGHEDRAIDANCT